MNLRKYLPRGLLLFGALSSASLLYGCEEPKIETIKGKPLSVQTSSAFQAYSFSTVIRVENKEILGRASGTTLKYIDAAALIDSEIKDGDNEDIELTGSYKGEIFYISSVSANGYRIWTQDKSERKSKNSLNVRNYV